MDQKYWWGPGGLLEAPGPKTWLRKHCPKQAQWQAQWQISASILLAPEPIAILSSVQLQHVKPTAHSTSPRCHGCNAQQTPEGRLCCHSVLVFGHDIAAGEDERGLRKVHMII
eukprot:1156376-Pelagomonas_calceolata.AAC.3